MKCAEEEEEEKKQQQQQDARRVDDEDRSPRAGEEGSQHLVTLWQAYELLCQQDQTSSVRAGPVPTAALQLRTAHRAEDLVAL